MAYHPPFVERQSQMGAGVDHRGDLRVDANEQDLHPIDLEHAAPAVRDIDEGADIGKLGLGHWYGSVMRGVNARQA